MEIKQRVLIVSHAFTPEGPRRQIDALSKYVDVRLVAPRVSAQEVPWPSRNRKEEAGGRSTFRRLKLFGHQYFLATLSMGMPRFRPEVVHIDHDPWSAIFWQTILISKLFAPKAAIVSGAKKNTYRHYPGLIGRAKRLLARAGMHFVDRIEAASVMTSKMYQREFNVDSAQISVITHMGVDTDRFQPSRDAAGEADGLVRVGYCGHYSQHKGVRTLLQACEILNSEESVIALSTVGAGPLRGEMEGLSEARAWLEVGGPVLHDDVASFMETLDIYVLAADVLEDHEEHDAHAMLQAMACGIPVVGSRSGIIPEILGEGSGVLIAPAEPHELATAISELVDEPEERERLSREGRARMVRSFSLDSVAARRAMLYRTASGRTPSSAHPFESTGSRRVSG